MHHTHVCGLPLIVCEGEYQVAAIGEQGEILFVQVDCSLDVVTMLAKVLSPELAEILEQLHLHRDQDRDSDKKLED